MIIICLSVVLRFLWSLVGIMINVDSCPFADTPTSLEFCSAVAVSHDRSFLTSVNFIVSGTLTYHNHFNMSILLTLFNSMSVYCSFQFRNMDSCFYSTMPMEFTHSDISYLMFFFGMITRCAFLAIVDVGKGRCVE